MCKTQVPPTSFDKMLPSSHNTEKTLALYCVSIPRKKYIYRVLIINGFDRARNQIKLKTKHKIY